MKLISTVVRPDRLPQKIFVQPLERVIRIRIGEVDTAAVTAVTADEVQRRALKEAGV